jgi:hypothetical protein
MSHFWWFELLIPPLHLAGACKATTPYISSIMHGHTHTHRQTDRHTHTHTHTHMHARTPAHTHTHPTHTCAHHRPHPVNRVHRFSAFLCGYLPVTSRAVVLHSRKHHLAHCGLHGVSPTPTPTPLAATPVNPLAHPTPLGPTPVNPLAHPTPLAPTPVNPLADPRLPAPTPGAPLAHPRWLGPPPAPLPASLGRYPSRHIWKAPRAAGLP